MNTRKSPESQVIQLGRIAEYQLRKTQSLEVTTNMRERATILLQGFLNSNPEYLKNLQIELGDDPGDSLLYDTLGGLKGVKKTVEGDVLHSSVLHDGVHSIGYISGVTKPVRDALMTAWTQIANIVRQEENKSLKIDKDIAISEALGFRDLAYYDQLTGLPNRTLFANEIAVEFDENDLNTTGLVLDIDNLKMINTLYGHDGGDAAIIQVGKILGEVTDIFNSGGTNITVPVRLSGDEFAVAIHGDAHLGEVFAETLHAALKHNPIVLKGQLYHIEITVGIATNAHTVEYPLILEQKALGVGAKIPLWFAKIMKHADTALEVAEKGASKVFDGASSQRNIESRYDTLVKEIQDLLRGINTNEEFHSMRESLLEKLITTQDVYARIDTMLVVLEHMKISKPTMTESSMILGLMSEVGKLQTYLRSNDTGSKVSKGH